MLLNKFRQSLRTRGVRGYIGLKKQLKIIDSDQTGFLTLNEFLQAFDYLKITNMQSGELKMVFEIYDQDRSGRINYQLFLNDLITELQPNRLRLVQEAFNHIDVNKNGVLELDELKAKFDPRRHPEVLSRVKTIDEAKFEFLNLFTSLHSANKNFRDDKIVTLEDFIEYHAFLNTHIERDCEFRNLVIGVWKMDYNEKVEQNMHSSTNFIDPRIAGNRYVAFPAKNTHEQWKHDFHRSQFGQ